MTGWIVLASIVTYLAASWRWFTPWFTTWSVGNQIRSWQEDDLDPARHVREWRSEAAAFGMLIAPFWPLWFAGWILLRRAAARAPLTEYEARQVAREQKARIAELERELGIGRR